MVDDSALMRTVLTKGLGEQRRIEVVGMAANAMEAHRKFRELKPDVMTLDIEMPGMSGIDFLKEFIPRNPLPVILVSSLNIRVFDALAAGAVDFVRKPDSSGSMEQFLRSLGQKICVAHDTRSKAVPKTAPPPSGVPTRLGGSFALERVIIGLGASTGGTEATYDLLRRLPADLPPMLIVQHMPTGFTKMYAERLDRQCAMEVREAVHGESLRRGLALVAPADLQMRIQFTPQGYVVSCKPDEKVSGHRPSVDALFESMAGQVRCKQVGIILTGMGRDGATGLLSMRRAGAYTLGQDEASSVVYGMPMVAHQMGAVQTQGNCEVLASHLLRHLRGLDV